MSQHVNTNEYHFFYNGPFSQWYKSAFQFNGILFNTAEQFMMYAKAMVFVDWDVAARILATNSPSKQKQLGRIVRDYDDDVWDGWRYNMVLLGNLLKFTQNLDLSDYLTHHEPVWEDNIVGGGSTLFVEASPTDKIWGIGLGMDDERKQDPSLWRGKNLLGMVITDVRNFLIGRPDEKFFLRVEEARERLVDPSNHSEI